MRPPARSRRAVLDQEEIVDAPTAVQTLHVTIPLKPQQTPTTAPPRLTQAVKDEFAIRYLQGIGASSTPENIAMVLQHLPVEKCVVTAAWKSRGSLSDVLVIDLNPKAHTQAGQTPVKPEGRPGIEREESSNTSPVMAMLSPRRQLRGQQVQHVYQIGTVCFSFDDMKRKFLLPFKLATPPAQADVLQLYGTHTEINHDLTDTLPLNQAEESALNTTPGSPIALGAIAKWEAQRRRTSVDERRVPPKACTETVNDMHNEFYITLPLASLGLSEGDEGTRTVLYEALLSPAMVELVQSTVRYLFITAICTSTSKEPRADTEQNTLFVSIAQNFAVLRSKLECKQRSTYRPQVAVLVPLLLLALRVDVETLVRLQYPMSFSCAAAEMVLLLQTLDTRISQMLDPDANWSRLASLETTHEAGQARASSSFKHARRHRHLRDQYFQTSSVLHGLFPDPSPGRSRRVMALRGGAGVSHYLDLSKVSSLSKDSTSSSASKHESFRNPDTVSVASKLSLLRSLRRSQQTKAQQHQ
ncbi:hypothetical protein P3T76_003492 [Phytophthora citrophthora]|uniref:Uncharacterized protein n=1 Tax=Phytophthora citrophthora TaxID=4793 RepID=A0AAD9GUQ1_9STRA|nr:hypothetical protein P3T76_003492 [Phytophthora citrophthora]